MSSLTRYGRLLQRVLITAYVASEYFVLKLAGPSFAAFLTSTMFQNKTFMTFPRLASLFARLQLPLMERSPGGTMFGQRSTFAVHKTAAGRWCWELNDETGAVLCRSTTEFVRQEQAIASARLVQCLAAESNLTDGEGRKIADA
jgi:hypothetical protein